MVWLSCRHISRRQMMRFGEYEYSTPVWAWCCIQLWGNECDEIYRVKISQTKPLNIYWLRIQIRKGCQTVSTAPIWAFILRPLTRWWDSGLLINDGACGTIQENALGQFYITGSQSYYEILGMQLSGIVYFLIWFQIFLPLNNHSYGLKTLNIAFWFASSLSNAIDVSGSNESLLAPCRADNNWLVKTAFYWF